VPLERLADIVAAFSDSEMFLLFTTRYGWTLDDTVGFLQQLLEREILDIG
jgi:hypothetical protein